MKNINLKSIGTAMVSLIALTGFCSMEATASDTLHQTISQKRNEVKPARTLHAKKSIGFEDLTPRVDSPNVTGIRRNIRNAAAAPSPAIQFSEIGAYDFLQAPDGSYWFYTTELDIERNVVNEWYTEEIIKGYKFTIYDTDFNILGTIQDDITLGEGETRVASVVLDPAVSYNFFNSDSKPEVLVFLAMNTSDISNFTVHYSNKVYSIGGESDENGHSKCLMTIPGRCVDAFNASEDGEENFYYTFVEDFVPNASDYDDLVGFINAYYNDIKTYSKATDENGPEVVLEKKIYLTRIPGDTTDGIYLITKSVEGKPYFIYSCYDKPYFVDPAGFATDESATPDNSFLIEVWTIGGNGADKVSETVIPVDYPDSSQKLTYSFYSIGSVGWKDDVDMSVNGSAASPSFIVAHDVVAAATYEDVLSSYEIYGADGKLIKEIAKDTESIVVFGDDLKGEPEVMYIIQDGDDYKFEIGGLYSGKVHFTLDQKNGGDPITASCARMLTSKGDYKYVYEMSFYDVDEEENDYLRLAWFNADGSFDRIDRINMGKGVMAATTNLYNLSPTLYDNDDAMEYAVLVKRGYGATTKNEFMVVDDNGDCIIEFTDNDGLGDPFEFTVFPSDEKMMIAYRGDNAFNINIYDLPLIEGRNQENGVGEIFNGDTRISYDGSIVTAQDCSLALYDTAGTIVAKGQGSISTTAMPAGIYLVVATDRDGVRHSAKIMIRQ